MPSKPAVYRSLVLGVFYGLWIILIGGALALLFWLA